MNALISAAIKAAYTQFDQNARVQVKGEFGIPRPTSHMKGFLKKGGAIIGRNTKFVLYIMIRIQS